MAQVDHIELVSSDSENEREDGVQKESSSPIGRAASGIPVELLSSTSKRLDVPSQKLPLPKGASVVIDVIDIDHDGHAEVHPGQDNAITLTNDIKYPKVTSYRGHLVNGIFIEDIDDTVDSNCIEVYDVDVRKPSSLENQSRCLPPSRQPSPSTGKSNVSMQNGLSFQIPEIGDKSYHTVVTNLGVHKVYSKTHFGCIDDEDVIMYKHKVHNTNRALCPSGMNGKSHPSPQAAALSDSAYHSGEERFKEVDERLVYQAALQDFYQPKEEATLPDGLMTVSLLRHQKIALAWMTRKETTGLQCSGGILADDQGLGKTISMIALIQTQRHLQSKKLSGGQQNNEAAALNVSDNDEPGNVMRIGECDDLKVIPEASVAAFTFRKGRPAGGTLVVCPASILCQWAKELEDKVADGAKLSVLVYHGGTRTKDPAELAKYDVVLTTYSIVANEVPNERFIEDDGEDLENEKYGKSSKFSTNKKRKNNADKKGRKVKKKTDGSSSDVRSGPLASVGWFRVILDEAQVIKNHRTQASRACCGLRAKRRWCLSGTPIQNKIDDLYSYFRFLKYEPYAVYKMFCSLIKYPTCRRSSEGYEKLQAVLRTILLRRTKETLIDGMPIITLPPKKICLVKVEFTVKERAYYAKLEADSCLQFKEYAEAGTISQNYANILLLLLRLRQACDHPLLVEGLVSKSIGKKSLEMAQKLPKDTVLGLLNMLENSSAICSKCSDPAEDAVVTSCSHVFCHQCVAEHLASDDNSCPAPNCKTLLNGDVVFSKATLSRYISSEFPSNATQSRCISSEVASNTTTSLSLIGKFTTPQNSYTSSKIRALLEILNSTCKLKNLSTGCNDTRLSSEVHENGTEFSSSHPKAPAKAIVFSQWTSMLDLVEIPLNQSGLKYRRLDGTMTLASRDKAVKDFIGDPEVTVMLMSLKAGNLGLNMVAATHVILLDLWWNPTTEDQAIDRAHRIGQTRPVTVSRLTVSNTVEDRILALQEKKRKLVASAFGEDQAGGPTQLTVEDLRYLFMF